MMSRRDRRRNAGAAGAHHQHVAFVGFPSVDCHAIRLAARFRAGWVGIDSPVYRVNAEDRPRGFDWTSGTHLGDANWIVRPGEYAAWGYCWGWSAIA